MKNLQFIPKGTRVFIIAGNEVREETTTGFVIRSGQRAFEPEIRILYSFEVTENIDAENVFETRGEALDANERWGQRSRCKDESGRTVYRSSRLGTTRSVNGWESLPAVWVK